MSLSKAKIKFIRSLQQKKYRQKYNNFIVEGDKMVAEMLRQHRVEIRTLYAEPDWIALRHPEAFLPAERVIAVSGSVLKKISGLTTPNQVLVIAQLPDNRVDISRLRTDYALLLDGIRDPGNMGTILRIADWFGISQVLRSPDCVDIYNPKVIQASMGAFLRVQAPKTDPAELLRQYPECPLLGTVMDGENVFQISWPGNGLILVGNEGRGLSAEWARRLTRRLTIPRHADGGSESLNAAVATGIICAVLRCQPGS